MAVLWLILKHAGDRTVGHATGTAIRGCRLGHVSTRCLAASCSPHMRLFMRNSHEIGSTPLAVLVTLLDLGNRRTPSGMWAWVYGDHGARTSVVGEGGDDRWMTL
jgi:hypothetical protein